MTSDLYPVLGVTGACALGRATELRRLVDNLARANPASLCVIGPRHIGKSFLLRRMVKEARARSGNLQGVVLLDLRAETPTTDDAFRRMLAVAVAEEIRGPRPDLMPDPPEFNYEWLSMVVSLLADEGKWLVVVLDGMDAVLHREGITAGLWQNLRALTQGSAKGLCFVTGSRAPLRELCASESSRTSNFWEVFDTEPVRVGAFGEQDWSEVLAPLRVRRPLDEAVRREIVAWTGGLPVLVAALLARLCEGGAAIDRAEVDRAAEAILASQPDLLQSLWEDCTTEMHGDLADAVRVRLPTSQVPEARRRALVQRGLVEDSGGALRVRAKLVQRFVAGRDQAVSELRRHFADADAFNRNIPRVLELRLAQIPRGKIDPNLRSKVEKAVRELGTETPDDAIVWLRHAFALGFQVAWTAEVTGNRLPDSWIETWKTTRMQPLPEQVQRDTDPAKLLGVLRKAMSAQGIPRVTRYITRPTFNLLSALKDAGDYGQHPDPGAGPTSLGTLTVWCLAAVELLERLDAELPPTR